MTDTSPARLRELAEAPFAKPSDECVRTVPNGWAQDVARVLAALAAEKEAGAPDSDADGWIPWSGGECPVATGTIVDVRYRDGEESYARPARPQLASRWRDERDASGPYWWHDGVEEDIIAYRIAKES